MTESIDKNPAAQKSPRQKYSKPTLTRFGKVRELTAGGTGRMTENDGGMMGNSFTDPNRQKP